MQTGVIFDIDGVLVDSGDPHAQSWRVLAQRSGVKMTDEDFSSTFGQTSRDIIRRFWGDDLTDERIREIDDEKELVYRDSIRDAVPLMPGVVEMLSNLRDAGFTLAVATSGPPENADLVLSAEGLRQYFAAVVTGFDIERGKPAPDCFLLAAKRAELDPANCVVVEDAPVGIQAAHAAGMKAVGFVGTHDMRRLIVAGADATANMLVSINPDLIRRLL